jgi:hypothetical protein
MKDKLRGRFNAKNPNIDVPGGLMWEFDHNGKHFQFRVDDIAGIGEERLQRYNIIWSMMIVSAYEEGLVAGKDSILSMTLAELLRKK